MEESSREAGRTVLPMSDEFRAALAHERKDVPAQVLPGVLALAGLFGLGGLFTWFTDPGWTAVIITLLLWVMVAAIYGGIVFSSRRGLQEMAAATEMVRARGRGRFVSVHSHDRSGIDDVELQLSDWTNRVVAKLRVSLTQREQLASFDGTWMEVDATVEGFVVIIRDSHGRRLS